MKKWQSGTNVCLQASESISRPVLASHLGGVAATHNTKRELLPRIANVWAWVASFAVRLVKISNSLTDWQLACTAVETALNHL